MTTQKEYQEELAISASVSAGFDTGFTAGEFSASADYQKAEETNEASLSTLPPRHIHMLYTSMRVCMLGAFDPDDYLQG